MDKIKKASACKSKYGNMGQQGTHDPKEHTHITHACISYFNKQLNGLIALLFIEGGSIVSY